MRLFAAIPLSRDVQDRLEDLQEGLPEGRLVPPETFHVTLGFFDECDRHLAADIDAGLEGLRSPAPELFLDGLGMFGEPRPRALYVALRPDPVLTRLREKVLNVARSAGVALKRERFVPHVTIARFSNGAGRGARMDRWVAARAGFAFGPVRPPAFALIRSDLGSGGPVYTELVRYPFAG